LTHSMAYLLSDKKWSLPWVLL